MLLDDGTERWLTTGLELRDEFLAQDGEWSPERAGKPISSAYLITFRTETIPNLGLSSDLYARLDASGTTALRKLSDVKRVSERFLLSIATQLAPSPLRVLLVGSQEKDFFLIREILVRNLGALP